MVRKTQALIRENPQFLFINEDLNTFVEAMPLSHVGK